MTTPNEVEVKRAVNTALDALFVEDEHLLSANASERSLSHMLAVHLLSQFPNYQVDCEYNRDGFDVKKLMLKQRSVDDDALDAVTVFPDVIVHRRGQQDDNVLVVEMKKASSSVNHDYDIQKLLAFKEELKYRFAAHVVIGYGKSGQLVREVSWLTVLALNDLPRQRS